MTEQVADSPLEAGLVGLPPSGDCIRIGPRKTPHGSFIVNRVRFGGSVKLMFDQIETSDQGKGFTGRPHQFGI